LRKTESRKKKRETTRKKKRKSHCIEMGGEQFLALGGGDLLFPRPQPQPSQRGCNRCERKTTNTSSSKKKQAKPTTGKGGEKKTILSSKKQTHRGPSKRKRGRSPLKENNIHLIPRKKGKKKFHRKSPSRPREKGGKESTKKGAELSPATRKRKKGEGGGKKNTQH